MNSYAYKLKLSSRIKIHSIFHISLLWFSKNDLIDRQVSLSQFMIVENEENLYFVNSIDNMKWNTKFTQFKLLIKWEEYKQKTWKSYTIIKKYINFDKRISSKSFFTICSDWINKKRESMIAFWHTIYKANHEHMNHMNLKEILKKIS